MRLGKRLSCIIGFILRWSAGDDDEVLMIISEKPTSQYGPTPNSQGPAKTGSGKAFSHPLHREPPLKSTRFARRYRGGNLRAPTQVTVMKSHKRNQKLVFIFRQLRSKAVLVLWEFSLLSQGVRWEPEGVTQRFKCWGPTPDKATLTLPLRTDTTNDDVYYQSSFG